MKHLVRHAFVFVALLAGPAGAAEVEWSLGGGIGSGFTRSAPFDLDGLTFAGPYRRCPAELSEGECLFSGASDVRFALQVKYPVLLGGGLDVRRPLGGPLAIGVGVTGAFAIRERRVLLSDTGEVVRERPEIPRDLLNSQDRNAFLDTDGLSGMAYVHAGLRYTRDVGSRAIGSRSRLKSVFVEAGGGWLPVVPGGEQSGLGHPPAVHGQAGVTLRRGVSGGLSLSLRYVRALASPDESLLVESKPSWLTFQAGWIVGH
jgi:hypothetical protein